MSESRVRGKVWAAMVLAGLTFLSFFSGLAFAYGDRSWVSWLYWADLSLTLFYSARFILGSRIIDRETKPALLAYTLASIPFYAILYSFGGHHRWALSIMPLRLLGIKLVWKSLGYHRKTLFVPTGLKAGLGAMIGLSLIHWVSCLWISLGGVQGLDDWETYNKALYWTVTTLTTVGYGDIIPTSNLQRMFALIVMISGVGVFGYMIGQLSKLLIARDRRIEKQKEKMADVNVLLNHYQLPKDLKEGVLDYYEHLLDHKIDDREHQLLAELPHQLQTEIQLHMLLKPLSDLELFKGCGKKCLTEVAHMMKQSFASPGEKVVRRGEMGHELFVLSHGEVEVRSGRSILAHIESKNCFGEMALIDEQPRNADVVALSYCELFVLERKDFYLLCKKHKTLKDNVRKISNERLLKKAS